MFGLNTDSGNFLGYIPWGALCVSASLDKLSVKCVQELSSGGMSLKLRTRRRRVLLLKSTRELLGS